MSEEIRMTHRLAELADELERYALPVEGNHMHECAAGLREIATAIRGAAQGAEPVAWRYRTFNHTYQRWGNWTECKHKPVERTDPRSEDGAHFQYEPLYTHAAPAPQGEKPQPSSAQEYGGQSTSRSHSQECPAAEHAPVAEHPDPGAQAGPIMPNPNDPENWISCHLEEAEDAGRKSFALSMDNVQWRKVLSALKALPVESGEAKP